RDEIRLGELVKEKYKTDFYVLDKFPISARPFYTMNDGKFTNSFDMFIRGQEICTGGQRITDPAQLRAAMKESGIDPGSMEEYLE
nr:aspartate--tRNA ligase 1, cytoplasmic-like isoform X2 [Tanacetum cinerariifolium]